VWEFKLRRGITFHNGEPFDAEPLYQQLDLYGVARRLDWKARGDERIKGYDMALRDAGGAR
jgi:ABC-type transport system substrate-binding protein